MFNKAVSFILAIIQLLSFYLFTVERNGVFEVNYRMEYQTFEGFGTSSAWWSQSIDDEHTADEIARLLYNDEEGLGLDIYRYNVGAGEKENPNGRIAIEERKTESFYVYNSDTGEYEYDFTRDFNARRMLDKAIENGAAKVILFCNSPHYSMTVSGQASGGLTEGVSNLPEENYGAFVDYLLTIADWFVEQGYPIYAISPINEPQWGWGGDWVGQEGCHYTADEVVKLMELFATQMQKRGCKYKLSGCESGAMSKDNFDYVEKYFKSDILNNYCDTFSGHSYWMDNNIKDKRAMGNRFSLLYPDKKFEMSEWCELPQQIDVNSIDSGLYMANIIIQDLNLFNAVSWQSWTGVHGDGLIDLVNGNIAIYNRYYANKQFSSFIKEGMTRCRVMFNHEITDKDITSTAFKDEHETVIVIVNNSQEPKDIELKGKYSGMSVYVTDGTHNCESTYSGEFTEQTTLTARSITTFVLT